MTRIAYVNGQYLPHREAAVHVEDRGYQFADGVYEVIAYFNRKMVDGERHLQRLKRSLDALGIDMPMRKRALRIVLQEMIENNTLEDGMLYIQVTRGVAKRDHIIKPNMHSSLVITVARMKPVSKKEITKGTEVITHEDIRWDRRDIKSISLLPNAMLKNEAALKGKRETWLLDRKGYITEGAVSNAFIVTKKGTLITRDESKCLLPGITRHRIISLAKDAGIKVKEKPFKVKDVKKAAEAFITSSTSLVVPVVQIDDDEIGTGKPGPVTTKLFELYVDYIEKVTGKRIWPN